MQGTIKLDVISAFTPFDTINPELLSKLIEHIRIERVSAGSALFHVGDFDADEYYLVKGELKLLAKDGRENLLRAGGDNCHYPIARLRPRMYTATAQNDVEYFAISKSVLDELQHSLQEHSEQLMVEEMKEKAGDDGHALLYEFQQELDRDRFILPSLPEVAFRIRDKADDPDCTLAELAQLVNADIAIAAKLIKTANSVVYRGVNPYTDTLSAISRLGLSTTKQLVTSFAVLALFNTDNHAFTKHITSLWTQGIEVAAFSYVLAKQMPTINEEEALLAGLLHSIGELVILSYAGRFYDLSTNEQQLASVRMLLRGHIGAMVLEKWNFSDELVTVAREFGDWLRASNCQSDEDFDLCDLVQIASIYASHSQGEHGKLPNMQSVPAFQKLAFSQEQTDLIIDEAEEQIAEIRGWFC